MDFYDFLCCSVKESEWYKTSNSAKQKIIDNYLESSATRKYLMGKYFFQLKRKRIPSLRLKKNRFCGKNIYVRRGFKRPPSHRMNIGELEREVVKSCGLRKVH